MKKECFPNGYEEFKEKLDNIDDIIRYLKKEFNTCGISNLMVLEIALTRVYVELEEKFEKMQNKRTSKEKENEDSEENEANEDNEKF